jgi:hypothetical protein
MNETEKDKEFIDMADAFIALANKYGKQTDKGKVSAAFLYAAARFNTFLVASGATSAVEFASYEKNAMEYFQDEYKKMLVEHFADYQQNFDVFIKPGTPKVTFN